MGYEFHITRAEHWANNEECPITTDEWLALVDADPELKLDPASGSEYFAEWIASEVGPDGAWFDWFMGNINTKGPSRASMKKMLQVAQTLNAKVQGDEGEEYNSIQDCDALFVND